MWVGRLVIDKVIYRKHEIKVVGSGNQWKAGAVRGGKMVGEAVFATSSDAAIVGVKANLDAMAQMQLAKRSPDGYPTVEEVYAALKAIKMSDGQRAMLQAHMAATGRILTATQLAASAGYETHSSANSHYGALGRILAEEMDYSPQVRDCDGTTIWTCALAIDADLEARNSGAKLDGEWRWQLRHEVFEAMCRLDAER